MVEVRKIQLKQGARLTVVPMDKFKTCTIGINLLTPLTEENASLNALIPAVLHRGTKDYPNMVEINGAMDDLYGGSIEPVVRKKGEVQCVGFMGSFLDDQYALDGSQILESATRLLGDLLLRPVLENGVFKREYVASEKSNLMARIQAQMNEKRSYAQLRVIQEMCKSEPYGIDRLGHADGVEAIDVARLWSQYQHLLKSAQVELYYCGSAPVERVERAMKDAFEQLPERMATSVVTGDIWSEPNHAEPELVTESMDVTQGKLAMGLRTGGITVASEHYPALMVFNAVFGGTATSKLFLNVREKLSLCYFASSMLEKFKGIMLVSAGIEFDKYEDAKAEILNQLEQCKQGNIEEWELTGAKRIIVSALTSGQDAQGQIEDFWLGQNVVDLSETQSQLARRIECVTMEEVVAVANGITLDTIYFLTGMEREGV